MCVYSFVQCCVSVCKLFCLKLCSCCCWTRSLLKNRFYLNEKNLYKYRLNKNKIKTTKPLDCAFYGYDQVLELILSQYVRYTCRSTVCGYIVEWPHIFRRSIETEHNILQQVPLSVSFLPVDCCCVLSCGDRL